MGQEEEISSLYNNKQPQHRAAGLGPVTERRRTLGLSVNLQPKQRSFNGAEHAGTNHQLVFGKVLGTRSTSLRAAVGAGFSICCQARVAM